MKTTSFIKFLRRVMNTLLVTAVELLFIYFVATNITGVTIALFGEHLINVIDAGENTIVKFITLEKEEMFYAFIHVLCIGLYVITNAVTIVERIVYVFTGKIGKNMRKAFD